VSRPRLTGHRWIWVPVCVALVSGACGSTAGPGDSPSYAAQVAAWRARKDAAFRTTRDSPIPEPARSTFTGLAYYSVDSRYRVPALLTENRANPPVIMELPTSGAERDKFQQVGLLGFTLDGKPYQLTAFASVDAADMRRLFVPFGDATNGAETYKGGRFLDLDRTPTGLYDLDFNYAYQPLCVYNPTYICPVPPRENKLDVAIRAGEKLRDVDRH
jgi:uncharacterized protein (DUF1684 family)